MFEFLRKSFSLVAPIDGKVIDLSQVPNVVFSQRMAGEGIAIEATGNIVMAPADGQISIILKTNHAFLMNLNNGIKLLVHIGLDTVALEGDGFERLVSEGQEVRAGDAVIKIDREKVLSRGYSLITPVLITNAELIKDIKSNTGMVVKAGINEVVQYRIK